MKILDCHKAAINKKNQLTSYSISCNVRSITFVFLPFFSFSRILSFSTTCPMISAQLKFQTKSNTLNTLNAIKLMNMQFIWTVIVQDIQIILSSSGVLRTSLNDMKSNTFLGTFCALTFVNLVVLIMLSLYL